jgi:alpha-mannosidase
LWVAPDHPPAHEAWDVEVATLGASRPVAMRAIDDEGDGSIAFRGELDGGGSVLVRYRLSRVAPVVEVTWEVDWQVPQRVLRAGFATGYSGGRVRYGAPFGSCLRPQWTNTAGDAAQYENPASRWAVAGDDAGRRGLMLVSRDKYGFGCRAGTLSLTLLRSPRVTDANDERPLRDLAPFGGRAWTHFADLGQYKVHGALGLFRAEAPRAEQPAVLADTLFTPPLRHDGKPGDTGLLSILGGDSLVPAWAKPLAGGSWLLRLHETLGCAGSASLRFAPDTRVTRCRADGSATGTTRSADDAFVCHFSPYELVTLRVDRI